MMLEIPNLLGLLLPMGLFLAIILAYGRMYADNEMTIFAASGFSSKQLLRYTLLIASCVAFIVALLNLYVGPYIAADRTRLLAMGASASVIDTLIPGRFQTIQDGKEVVYVENVARDRRRVNQLFAAQQTPTQLAGRHGSEWTVLSATKGHVSDEHELAGRFFVAEQGHRYKGVAGEKDFERAQFKAYGIRITAPVIRSSHDIRGVNTSRLWPINNANHRYAAELQWRLSIPLMALILAFIAVPLSRIKPRHGKYARIFPAVLVLITYANMMFVVRNWLRHDVISPAFGMWWLHAAFVGFGVLLCYASSIRLGLRRWIVRWT